MKAKKTELKKMQYRLSVEIITLIQKISIETGIKKAFLVERAIKEMAERMGIE